MNEDELLEVLEEFEMVSEIKDFFEKNCKDKAITPFDMSLLVEAAKKCKEKRSYTTDVLLKDISAVNNSSYNHKTPLYLINTEENMDNALKAYMNSPESLFEGGSKKKLSFLLVTDNEGNKNYFLDSPGNHRVMILLILSDVCKELCLHDVEVTELIL